MSIETFVSPVGLLTVASSRHTLTVAPTAEASRFVVVVADPGCRARGRVVDADRCSSALELAGDLELASWVRGFARAEASS